jgi:hypothetical protein
MSSIKASVTVIGIVLLIVTLGVIIPIVRIGDGVNQEGFITLSPGMYPKSLDDPILSDTYKVKKDPGYDKMSSSDIFVNYPQFPAKHCGTNNIRYWRRPTNGLCSPPGFCMGLYDATEPKITPPPDAPNGTPRVNYYVSHKQQ